MQVADARKAARENASLDTLQRETNRLLRQALIEQQIVTRAGKSKAAPMCGRWRAASRRRRSTACSPSTTTPPRPAMTQPRIGPAASSKACGPSFPRAEDQHRVDLACDRPDRVNPVLVARYLEALQEAAPETLDGFVAQAIETRNADAYCAAFASARNVPRVPTNPGRRRCSMG